MSSDLPADLIDIVEHLDGSQKSIDVLGGLLFRSLAKINRLDQRVTGLDQVVQRVVLLDEIVSKLAQRLRRLEAQPEAISPDEPSESELPKFDPADTRRSRRGRPKGSLNKKTILQQRMAELTGNGLGTAA
jgi:hypothetical protein